MRRLVSRSEPLAPAFLWRLWGASWRGLVSYDQASRLAADRAASTVV